MSDSDKLAEAARILRALAEEHGVFFPIRDSETDINAILSASRSLAAGLAKKAAARPLTGDEIHVVLDVITSYRGFRTPAWRGYDSDPATDPKASEAGWMELLDSADIVLSDQLEEL